MTYLTHGSDVGRHKPLRSRVWQAKALEISAAKYHRDFDAAEGAGSEEAAPEIEVLLWQK